MRSKWSSLAEGTASSMLLVPYSVYDTNAENNDLSRMRMCVPLQKMSFSSLFLYFKRNLIVLINFIEPRWKDIFRSKWILVYASKRSKFSYTRLFLVHIFSYNLWYASEVFKISVMLFGKHVMNFSNINLKYEVDFVHTYRTPLLSQSLKISKHIRGAYTNYTLSLDDFGNVIKAITQL